LDRNNSTQQEQRVSATAEAIDNLRRLSDSIKKKIAEQEVANQLAKDRMKVKSSHLSSSINNSGSYAQNSALITNATSSVGSSTRIS
jgi:hypothetical protein